LRRLACIDDTPKNTESYFVGKTLRWLIQNTQHKTMVTYADPSFNHTGIAYRACNMKYDGLSGTTVVLELPVEKCVHPGSKCLGEGKTVCQVHDRNMRCKVKGGSDFTPQAKYLRMLHEQGIAKLEPRKAKHRYHYHLAELREGKPQDCRQCRENQNKIKAIALTTVNESLNSPTPQTKQVEPKITDITKITERIEKAWLPDSSYWPEKWTEANPACGQCAVTALIVQENLGGELLKCDVEGFGSHYFNQLPDGTIIDLTKKQFPTDAKMSKAVKKKREDVTQYKQVMKRYEILKDNFNKAI
jgi:hypothetical protein